MVLESLLNPFNAESSPRKVVLLGFLYCSVAILLSLWIFKSQSSLILVFLTAMAALPLIYNTIKMEEGKDLYLKGEKALLKEHGKALSCFINLFIGITVAVFVWYVLVSPATVDVLFKTQTDTITAINGRVTGAAGSQWNIFSKIFFNNMKVLIFCVLFSFLYGSGAIFILTWNASVIGTAIGNFIRTNLASYSNLVGWDKTAHYFQVISIGLFKYVIHGVPEILGYFTAALAGGIISVAVIKHDFSTRKFEHILLDSADLMLLSIFIILVAALLEVYVTPLIF